MTITDTQVTVAIIATEFTTDPHDQHPTDERGNKTLRWEEGR
jgi:hypothetical protein